ncbi:MAG TPA: hypothetical protein VGI58_16205 [Streptosporangiaceae bacterium]
MGLQVAASAAGSAVLPAGLGLVIGSVGPRVVAPSLLTLALAMCALYALLTGATRARVVKHDMTRQSGRASRSGSH